MPLASKRLLTLLIPSDSMLYKVSIVKYIYAKSYLMPLDRYSVERFQNQQSVLGMSNNGCTQLVYFHTVC